VSGAATGPRAFCTTVPAAIYIIPPSSPCHNVTYVVVQSSTPTTVVYSLTAGYSGEYVAATGVLMFGAGMLVGAGLNAMYGLLDTKVGVNNAPFPPIPTADGQLALKDHTWGFGANVGLLVHPFEKTRIGLTYLSAVDLDFADTPSFTGLGPGLSAWFSVVTLNLIWEF
jgi:hypothetical protein